MNTEQKLRNWATKCIAQCQLDLVTADGRNYERLWACQATLKQVIAILDGQNVPGLEPDTIVDDRNYERLSARQATLKQVIAILDGKNVPGLEPDIMDDNQ
jgi:hypothetical protein